MDADDEIARTRRYINAAEHQVRRQHAILSQMRENGGDVSKAEHMLAGLEAALARHRAELAEAENNAPAGREPEGSKNPTVRKNPG